jgi:hypothetical protein
VGCGVGAFGLVFAKAVDMTGITAPAYLAVLTVRMGGALGLVSSRSMDQFDDQRKMRRRIYGVVLLIKDSTEDWPC